MQEENQLSDGYIAMNCTIFVFVLLCLLGFCFGCCHGDKKSSMFANNVIVFTNIMIISYNQYWDYLNNLNYQVDNYLFGKELVTMNLDNEILKTDIVVQV